MKTHPPSLLTTFLALATLAPTILAADEAPPAAPLKGETLEAADGHRTTGRLEGDPVRGYRFVATEGDGAVVPLEPGMLIVSPGDGPSSVSGQPPFRVDLGQGHRLLGRLASVSDREVELLDVAGAGRFSIARGGVHAVVQRAGESIVLQDNFESLDTTRWAVVGEPEIVAEPRISGMRSLRIVAGGASLTHRLDEPFASGRFEIAFYDARAVVAGQQWFVDLTFRAETGQQTVRAILGWAEESLALESPGGPALAVQRLARRPGWHRLSVRFGPERCEVSVDGNSLGTGKGLEGPLLEIRLASYQAGKIEPPDDLAGHLDDLQLVRFNEPDGAVETDATQDEVRLTGSDQLFGKLRSADAEKIELTIDGRDVSLSWADVSGLYFRRAAVQGAAIEGLLVDLQWRAGAGTDRRDLNIVDGALVGLTETELTLATPYAGTLVVPRSRLTSLRVAGRGRRIVIDSMAHHLGDEISLKEPFIDPPQPEGGILERPFDLPTLPAGAAHLVLDVVQVVGEEVDSRFSARVKKGELRTNVKINGEPFDYLNRYITSKNETPERIRLPIPRGLLRPGRNAIRFEQAGTADDPNFLDDLGLLGIAVEFTAAPDGKPTP